MTSPIITEAVRALVDRRDLTRIEAAAAMEAIMSGAATDAQIAAFLTGLRMKGETVEELIGFAQVMRQKAVRVRTRGEEVAALTGTDREMLIDTCGTGGDAAGTFNVSTATAFVVAARREMGIRTVFNMLGPLTNPANANAQVIGVYAATLTEPLARVLAELGTVRAFVVHGSDGLDEISNTGESRVSEVREGVVRSFAVRPDDFGMARATIADLQGGDREQNAQLIRGLLDGEVGPKRDIVLMNSAAALVAGGKARDLKDGVSRAVEAIDSGAARSKLQALVSLSQKLAQEK